MGVTVENTIRLRDRMSDPLRKIRKETDETSRGFSGMAKAAIVANQAIGLISKVGNAISSVAKVADEYNTLQARIEGITRAGEDVVANQEAIYQAAQRSRMGFTDMADFITKVGSSAKDAFGSTDEIVRFSELLNKAAIGGGYSGEGLNDAFRQLTQGLASGTLRGEELNSVLEQATPITERIAQYMGVPIGKLRKLAEEGKITAQVVKNAMFAAEDQINQKFNEMPITFAQAMTVAKNAALNALQPLMTAFSQMVGFVVNNWATIQPILVGIAGGIIAAAAAWGIYTVAQWIATGAAKAFFTALLSNPLMWIAVVVGVIIGFIYKWVQAVGGLQIAWMIVTDYLMYAWDMVKYGFMVGVNWILNLWDSLQLGLLRAGNAIANVFGDIKANVLSALQTMVNSAIKIINDFIGVLNKIPGVNIEAIGAVTFGAQAQAENEANKQARTEQLAAASMKAAQAEARRGIQTDLMKEQAAADHKMRQYQVQNAQSIAAEKKASKDAVKTTAAVPAYKNTKGTKGDPLNVTISDEDLKYMRDSARMQFINKFTTLRPSVKATFGDIRETADVNELLRKITESIEEATNSALA